MTILPNKRVHRDGRVFLHMTTIVAMKFNGDELRGYITPRGGLIVAGGSAADMGRIEAVDVWPKEPAVGNED
jgi:hypothetical protein